ncbi:MAG: orotidine 5'-phosphate decarboxylase, partial [Saprospiraceae bacterium]|nr:orotidine 5'-phosphate decarboxylase [Saprospiraceae bacterium]
MSRSKLFDQIIKKKSFLCVGLDSDIERIPRYLMS